MAASPGKDVLTCLFGLALPKGTSEIQGRNASRSAATSRGVAGGTQMRRHILVLFSVILDTYLFIGGGGDSRQGFSV